MAQYPQGIFQSLQWLLKKVKILALQKQPVYTLPSSLTTVYNMPGRGMYNGNETSGAGALQFPDPALLQGQTIMLNFPSGATINSTYAPLQGGNPLTVANIGTSYTIVSNGTNWIVVGVG
jgi:hypothetical protein